jgi:putative oxidoreductase
MSDRLSPLSPEIKMEGFGRAGVALGSAIYGPNPAHPSLRKVTDMGNNAALQGFLAVVGRLLLAIIFLASGVEKVADPSGTIAYITSANLPLPTVAYAVAVLVELGGGALLVLGYQARLIAIILAVFTLASAIGFHMDFADQNQTIHFMKNLAIAGGFLQIAAFGAGGVSLDARTGRA